MVRLGTARQQYVMSLRIGLSGRFDDILLPPSCLGGECNDIWHHSNKEYWE
jgi:hypothetical protein